MIKNFGNKVAKDIWTTNHSKKLPASLHLRAKSLLQIMHSSESLDDLMISGQPPNIRLHKLKGSLRSYWSITLLNSSPWRIIFTFKGGEYDDVQIVDYHEG